METVLDTKQAIKGGEFIVRETEANEVFIPEEFGEEQRMMAQACQDFLDTEVYPNIERMEKLEEGNLSRTLSHHCSGSIILLWWSSGR